MAAMDGEDLRLAVCRAFAETGRGPDAGELAARFCSLLLEIPSSWISMSLMGALAIHDDRLRDVSDG
jgi:hypothetical protein